MQNVRRIKRLPTNLVNRIAAGEVIERPASALKEIIENSIDAGATKIDINLIAGGIDQIKVIDNGYGIDKDDLVLAIDRHATSKIYEEEELYTINTLGFRGEGLASIASVANFSLASKAMSNDIGYQIKSKFGIISPVVPIAMNHGVVVEVNELYHTIPARKKFMKSEATEYGHCKNIFQRLALANPEISFSLKHNQKIIFELPGQSLSDRIGQLYGDVYAKHALNVLETSSNKLIISGYVYHPSNLATNNMPQYFFINRRYVRDKVVQNAVKQGFAGVLHNIHSPAYVLFLEMDPSEIDVNVHPTKTEVRFRDSGAIHSFISNCVRKSLAGLNTTTTESIKAPSSKIDNSNSDIAKFGGGTNYPGFNNLNNTAVNNQLIKEWLPNKNNIESAAKIYTKPSQLFDNDNSSIDKNVNLNLGNHLAHITSSQGDNGLVLPDGVTNEVNQSNIGFFGNALGQLHGVYVLAQNEDGLLVVDIHAAHERIILESLTKQVSDKSVIKQGLLIPVQVKLTSLQLATVTEYLTILAQLGFDIELVDDENINILAIPQLLIKQDIVNLVNHTLDDLTNFGNSHKVQANISEILSVIACHSAVRANDYLAIAQMNSLLRQMEQTLRASYCNHGRPTWFKITMNELDSMFMRGK